MDLGSHVSWLESTLKYSLPVAYALWALSGGGALGLHRFYLGKAGTGFLWLFTGGLAGAGCIYDLFTLPRQVRDANASYALAALNPGSGSQVHPSLPRDSGFPKPDSTERIILKAARRNGGQVTPGEIAIEGNISMEDARKELDKLAKSGMAEIRVRSSGVVVYFFPEFSSEKSEFVDL